MLKIKFVLNLHSLNSNGIGLWCNGNTTVFGAVFLGSSPSRPTKASQILRGFFHLKKIRRTVGVFVNAVLLVIFLYYKKKLPNFLRSFHFHFYDFYFILPLTKAIVAPMTAPIIIEIATSINMF